MPCASPPLPSVRGVCKRFSEFKELDAKIRAHFPAATFTATFPPDQVLYSIRSDSIRLQT